MKTLIVGILAASLLAISPPLSAEELPGTKPLTRDGDLAAQMVEGIDKYLMRELDSARTRGGKAWHIRIDSLAANLESVKPNRDRLTKILGVVDERIKPVKMEYVGEGTPSAMVAETKAYKVYAVRWSVLPGVDGEGLLLEPTEKAKASAVAIPDADQTPEQIVGLAPGVPVESQFARHLAENGCRVIVPVLIDRKDTWSGNPRINRQTNLSHREFIWRMAYEMGRHIIGFEIQKVLAAVDWLKGKDDALKVGVYGYGEGALIALYGGALDPRIKATVASSIWYESRHLLWQEPIDRSVWGLLPEFRDDYLQLLFGDRTLLFEHSNPPHVEGPPQRAGHREAAPGRLSVSAEMHRQIEDVGDREQAVTRHFAINPMDLGGFGPLPYPEGGGVRSDYGSVRAPKGVFGNHVTTEVFLFAVGVKSPASNKESQLPASGEKRDPIPRQKRQFDQLVAYTQKLWRQSDLVRKQYWAKADASSPEKWERSCEAYRNEFWEDIIGKLPKQTEPPNPKTRQTYETAKWKGYEVTLDLYPDVYAYGILLVPKDLKPGEKRPVVVCQHGLEGKPQDVVNPEKRTPYYQSFGAQLADMGYIVYAPQNPYIGHEKFRVLLRKSHPLKLSLYAFIVRQHETATDWLATLPFVEPDKIAFYGLSYGGKTAMRIPALIKRYCLSICAGDFNEWIGKNVSVDFFNSYMWTVEYDMYEFNLGHTFNYAEMANLIAPRPFMVERGHDDGVGVDEMIAWEYAKVRYLYANRLKIPENTAIEFRPGGHEIFLKGTADFLKKHTGWPK